MKNLKSRLIMFVLLVGLVFSGYKIVDYFYTSYDEKQNFNNVEKLVESEYEDEKIQYNDFEILKKYKKVYEKNNDLVGWIKIKDTNIDYPVMQTKKDSEYYLHRNFEKKSDVNGLPFLDAKCDIDELKGNLMVYGHHMKSGLMFAHLEDFEKADFYKKHKTIEFDTLYEKRQYEVVAVFRSKVYKENEDVFKYYRYVGKLSKKQYETYVKNCKKLSIYKDGATPAYGEQLLTLVTCAYHTENGRFVVVARKKENV